jgi:emfourin
MVTRGKKWRTTTSEKEGIPMNTNRRLARWSVFGFAILWAVPVLAQMPQHLSGPSGDADGILYTVRGGLVAADDRLEIDSSGLASITLSNAIQGSRTLAKQLGAREQSLLLSLFQAAGFDSMPARFVPDGQVEDGARLSVTWTHGGVAHVVESETAALESAGFTLIRQQLDGIVADALDEVVLSVRAEGGIVGARQSLDVKASGEWAYRWEIPGGSQPVVSASGTLPQTQLARLHRAVETDGFMALPACEDGRAYPDVMRYEVTVSEAGIAHTVHFDDSTAGEFEVLGIVRTGIARLSQRAER